MRAREIMLLHATVNSANVANTRSKTSTEMIALIFLNYDHFCKPLRINGLRKIHKKQQHNEGLITPQRGPHCAATGPLFRGKRGPKEEQWRPRCRPAPHKRL